MSHHLDTPLAARNGQLYLDDLYVFPGQDSTVFVMDVNSSITGVYAQPGFHPEARYEFKVHVDGADVETLTYRLAFGAPDAEGRQNLRLEALSGSDASEDAASATVLLEGRTGETAAGEGVKVWAGRISDSFYIDLSLLAVVNEAVGKGSAVDLSGWLPGEAKNSFAGTTVETIVLEVSHEHAVLRPGTRIGVWAATKLATDAGGWRQINRAGHPMMWPIFWPGDTDFTNPANTRHPSQDRASAAVHRRPGRRRGRGDRHLDRPGGLRPGGGPAVAARRAALRRRHPGGVRFRHAQRPHPGGQRARGDALAGDQHGRGRRADAGHRG